MPNAKPTTKTTTTKASTQGAKKTQSKPEPKKAQSKGPVKSTNAKATKATTEKKPARKNLTQCVGFVYSGSLIKGSHVYLFQCDNSDAVTHVRETLVPYFGGNVNGRYVKCEDAEETMTAILESATEQGYHTDEDCQQILKCTVGDAATLLKTCSGATIAHLLKLKEEEAEDKPKKASAKAKAPTKGSKGGNSKKAVAEEEDDAEDDEDADDDEDAEVSDEAEEGEEGEEGEDDEEAEEEEEEVKPAPKKASNTKTTGKPANAKGGKAPQQKSVAKKGGK